jgi:hypothetical protein
MSEAAEGDVTGVGANGRMHATIPYLKTVKVTRGIQGLHLGAHPKKKPQLIVMMKPIGTFGLGGG